MTLRLDLYSTITYKENNNNNNNRDNLFISVENFIYKNYALLKSFEVNAKDLYKYLSKNYKKYSIFFSNNFSTCDSCYYSEYTEGYITTAKFPMEIIDYMLAYKKNDKYFIELPISDKKVEEHYNFHTEESSECKLLKIVIEDMYKDICNNELHDYYID